MNKCDVRQKPRESLFIYELEVKDTILSLEQLYPIIKCMNPENSSLLSMYKNTVFQCLPQLVKELI